MGLRLSPACVPLLCPPSCTGNWLLSCRLGQGSWALGGRLFRSHGLGPGRCSWLPVLFLGSVSCPTAWVTQALPFCPCRSPLGTLIQTRLSNINTCSTKRNHFQLAEVPGVALPLLVVSPWGQWGKAALSPWCYSGYHLVYFVCQFLQAKFNCLLNCALFSGYKLIGSHSGVKLCRWTKVCSVSFSSFINKNKSRDFLKYSNFLVKYNFKMCYYLHKPRFYLSSCNLAFPTIKIPLQRVRIQLSTELGRSFSDFSCCSTVG